MAHTIEETRDGKLLLVKLGPLGPVSNNAYIVADTSTNEGVIIDAPAESAHVIPALGALNLRLVIVTHRHRDHWGGIDELLAGVEAPVFTHEQDREPWAQYVTGTLDNGDQVEVGNLRLEVIHTPGHTQGSICLRFGEHLLSGDTLFPGGPGRTQTPELLAQEIQSITSRLYTLPDSLVVYPGHGANTTVGKSKEEYAVFASKPHDPGLAGDVNWLTS
jgi:glyoxylase-like metal-dependent hydrolase (beta-lactamase superfamily II)